MSLLREERCSSLMCNPSGIFGIVNLNFCTLSLAYLGIFTLLNIEWGSDLGRSRLVSISFNRKFHLLIRTSDSYAQIVSRLKIKAIY